MSISNVHKIAASYRLRYFLVYDSSFISSGCHIWTLGILFIVPMFNILKCNKKESTGWNTVKKKKKNAQIEFHAILLSFRRFRILPQFSMRRTLTIYKTTL
uniref:Uncharacterized protein n=1 Tax=Cacopsylla melanoneura TaxID=428564 RepID=A0A8D8QPU4_9HEMI